MRITRANSNAIKHACLYFHYAKRIPAYSYAYNIYNSNDEWCGCILFGVGTVTNMPNFLNCEAGACLELQRVALNGKQGRNTTSKALSMAMREVKKDAVFLRCLFSYADTFQNHLGIIYQATNWIYIGESSIENKYEVNGVYKHSKTIRELATSKNISFTNYIKLNNFNIIKGKIKYLYIYPYDKNIKKYILTKQKPYPKREIINEK